MAQSVTAMPLSASAIFLRSTRTMAISCSGLKLAGSLQKVTCTWQPPSGPSVTLKGSLTRSAWQQG